MSEHGLRHRSGSEIGMFAIRYGIGVVMVVAGIVLLVAVPGTGIDGFAMAAGGGLSVVLLNWLFRLSVTSDQDRVREEEARRYFDEHGEWPDEALARERQWRLPAGAVSAAEEEATRRRG